jgi:GNAT superfamily N-acetyltransferase
VTDDDFQVAWPLPRGLRPPGYPAELERIVTLKDGLELPVRPIVPSDAPSLGEAIRHADLETLLRRFFTTRPNIGTRRLRQLTELDYRFRLALIAVAQGRGVGIARYTCGAARDAAEIALVVSPAWRRRGLGTALLGLLEDAALSRSVTRFNAFFLADSEAVVGLLSAVGFRDFRVVDGVGEAVKILPGPPNPLSGSGCAPTRENA